jgi:hypothetical protein
MKLHRAEFQKHNLDAMDYQTANSQFETGSTVRIYILFGWNCVVDCSWFWDL